MNTSQEHNDALQNLLKKGVKLALDDFGTGYWSLDYLHRFPVDRIKLAQEFIIHIEDNSGDAAIVRAAIGLAHEMKIKVIAEGVETLAQAELLKSWGCRDGQGFYFS